MTPEARTKRRIKSILDKYNNHIYYYMPVPGGYGATTWTISGSTTDTGSPSRRRRRASARPRGRCL